MSSAHGKLHKQQQLAAHAHRMRGAPSESERVLWQALRCCQLGTRFRQQVVLHGFIVDFFAPSARLVVEVDGAQHTRQRGADKRRDRALQAAGLTVLRLPAKVVLGDLPLACGRSRRRSRANTPAYWCVSFHSMATMRSSNWRAASASPAWMWRQPTATRSAARVSFVLPKAVKNRAR
jgi:very-short-patch-repair endonuclease